MTDITGIELRIPTLEDGPSVYRLIASCPPLDTNSRYCNLLQCDHFHTTSVAAELEGELVGFVSGYHIPQRPDTLFVWQVAASEQARGKGLASRMIRHILDRPVCKETRYLETSITRQNQASWALFKSLSKSWSAEFHEGPWMAKEPHFEGLHDSEMLVRIGPIQSRN